MGKVCGSSLWIASQTASHIAVPCIAGAAISRLKLRWSWKGATDDGLVSGNDSRGRPATPGTYIAREDCSGATLSVSQAHARTVSRESPAAAHRYAIASLHSCSQKRGRTRSRRGRVVESAVTVILTPGRRRLAVVGVRETCCCRGLDDPLRWWMLRGCSNEQLVDRSQRGAVQPLPPTALDC